MARIQLKIWRAPLANLQANLAEGEVGIASETNTFYKRPDGNAAGALIPIGGGGGVATLRAKVATTGNIALSGLNPQDGVAIAAGDFVMVGRQSNPAQNGMYVAAAGAWQRAAGADSWTNLINAIYVVEQGATLADTIWMCTSDTGGTLDTDAVSFQAVNNKTGAILASVTPSANALPYFVDGTNASTTLLTPYARTLLAGADQNAVRGLLDAQQADADLSAIADLTGAGMFVRTGDGSAAIRQFGAVGTGLTVSNADGVGGNPTFTINSTDAATAGTIVARDASGNFAANIVSADLAGNADTASVLATARTVTLDGDVSGAFTFDGSTDTTLTVTLDSTGVAPGTYSSLTVDAKGRVTAGSNAGGSMSGGNISGSTIADSTIDNTIIGGTTAAAGYFTTLQTTGDTIIGGNLTVNGTTVTVNSTTVTIDDPIFTLGGDTAPTIDDNKDRGIEFRWHNGSAAKRGFFGFDDSTGKFTFIPDATNTSEVFTGAVGTVVANLEGIVYAADGSTAVTQPTNDNSTKIATTAFAQAAATAAAMAAASDAALIYAIALG